MPLWHNQTESSFINGERELNFLLTQGLNSSFESQKSTFGSRKIFGGGKDDLQAFVTVSSEWLDRASQGL